MPEEHHERAPRSSMGEVFTRVGVVEKDVAGVRTELATLGTNVANMSATLARISVNIEQRGATDWKALASWASVILAIVGLFASLMLTPIRAGLDANTAAIERINEARIADARLARQDIQIQIDQAERRGRRDAAIETNAAEILRLRDRLRDYVGEHHEPLRHE